MATLRDLKARIASVASSEKITGAMKMISSAKMHKAELDLRQQLPFRDMVDSIIANILSTDATFESPLTEKRDIRHITILAFGSDDGLCGAYNINIAKALQPRIAAYKKQYDPNLAIRILAIGEKIYKAAQRYAADYDIELIKAPGVDSKTDGEGIRQFLQHLIADFTDNRTDLIEALYMNFISVSRQRTRFDALIPIATDSFAQNSSADTANNMQPRIFEPNPETIFAEVLPLYLLATLTEIFTENRASQQAARMMAMQTANDNAKKLLDELRLEYNKLRQAAITTELLDIVGGQVR